MDTPSGAGSIVLLTRLARLVYRRSTEDLLGIRLKELMVLAYLRDHTPASQQTLSEAMQLDANTCVLMLNELEGSGFATLIQVMGDVVYFAGADDSGALAVYAATVPN